MTCHAKTEHGTHFTCGPCGLSWDTDDPQNPPTTCRDGMVCAVCEGEAGAIRIGRFDVCLDPRCAEVAKVWITRQSDGSTYWESEAVKAGGKAGGQYLQRLGVFDLSKLTADQYGAFARTIVQKYRAELRHLAALRAPPF